MPDPILEISGVREIYPGRRGLFGAAAAVTALDDVSLAVRQGESFGLVGESGSGKTTLTRSVLHLETPTKGAIRFHGTDLAQLSAVELRRMRARIQIVFQDPYASLNPRMSVQDIVTEPMLIHHATLGLTPRQGEILALVQRGLPNKRIAQALDLSESTVKEHITSILSRLGVPTRVEAITHLQGRRLNH